MASIIRSPVISDKKRKLTTRRARTTEEKSVDAALGARVAEGDRSNAGPPQTLDQKEVNALVEQGRLAVLAQFKEEAEAARELGRQRGLREGRTAGTEEARQSLAAEFARMRTIADNLEQAMASGIHGVEDMAVAIAFEAVCKIMGNAAATLEGIQALVRQAAAQAHRTEGVVVRLHPSDLSLLRDAGALDAALPSGCAVSWVADKGIALGGCVIETDGGELDARLETQMERLRVALVAARQPG